MTTNDETPRPRGPVMTATERLAEIRARAEAATIPGFTDYEAQADGTIWSNQNWRGSGRRQITPVFGAGGYLKVRLRSPEGRRVNRKVHALIAEVFLGERPPGAQIRHLNGERTDNRVSNLAYGTAKENAKDRDAHGTTARGSRNGWARLSEGAVRSIREASSRGLSQRAIAAQHGVTQKAVWRVLSGKGWTHV